MTTCLAHITTLQHVIPRRTRQAASAPTCKPTGPISSKNLLRVLTGADSARLPHHPRRRPSRRS